MLFKEYHQGKGEHEQIEEQVDGLRVKPRIK